MALLRRLYVAGAVGLILSACSTGPATPPVSAPDRPAKKAPVEVPSIGKPDRSIARAIVRVNRYRAAHGRGPVAFHSYLNKAALRHARAMAMRDFFSHTGADGSTMGQRLTQTGYIWGLVAENIAAGQKTPREVIRTWIDSPGHRRNILMKGVVHIGLAHFRRDPDPGDVIFKDYWVMVLAAPIK